MMPQTADGESERVMSPWTDERIEKLRSLWPEPLTCEEIAQRIGCGITKNAVIGKANRLGLPFKRNPPGGGSRVRLRRVAYSRHRKEPAMEEQPSYVEPAPITLPKAVSRPPAAVVAPVIFRPKPKLAPELELEPDPINGVALLDLKAHQCRWPVGTPGEDGFHFCGRRKAVRGSYCLEHLREALGKPSEWVPRRRKPQPVEIGKAVEVTS